MIAEKKAKALIKELEKEYPTIEFYIRKEILGYELPEGEVYISAHKEGGGFIPLLSATPREIIKLKITLNNS